MGATEVQVARLWVARSISDKETKKPKRSERDTDEG
jgi:hypothetical protein